MSFFAKLKSSFSSSSTPQSSTPTASRPTSSRPVNSSSSSRGTSETGTPTGASTPPASSALKRRRSLGTGTLFRARSSPLDPAPAARAPEGKAKEATPRLELAHEVEAEGRAPSPSAQAVGPPLSEEEQKANEEEVLASLQLKSKEVAELVGLIAGKLKERGLGVPDLYLPTLDAPSPAAQKLLLAYLRLRRPTLLPQPRTHASDLALPAPSPAYLLDLEFQYYASGAPASHELAQLLLFTLRRVEPSPARERWYALFAEAERAGGYVPRAWETAGKEGDEKRFLGVLTGVLMDAGAWEGVTGVSLARLALLVGWWALRPVDAAPSNVEDLSREWEEKGRKLEHLALAFVRDQADRAQIPARLLPLVEGYPYAPTSSSPALAATHSKSSSTFSLPLASGVSSLSALRGTPPLSTQTVRVLHVVLYPPGGQAGAVEPGQRVDPLRLAEWAVTARAAEGVDGGRGSLAAEVWREILALAAASDVVEDGVVRPEDLFASHSLDQARVVADRFPSTPVRPPAPAPKPEEPLYRPFPRSESSFLLREGKVESAADNVVLGAPLAGTPTRPSHTRQRSKSYSAAAELSFSPVSRPADQPSTPRTPSSTWANFSSFGFDSTAASAELPKLNLGEGLDLLEGSKAPKRLNARSRELERILQGEELASGGVSPVDAPNNGSAAAANDTPVEKKDGQPILKSVSIIKVDATFLDFALACALDPAALSATFPTFFAFTLHQSLSTVEPRPRGVIVSLAPPVKPAPKPRPEPLALAPPPAFTSASEHNARKERRRSGLASLLAMGSFSRKKSASGASLTPSASSNALPALSEFGAPARRGASTVSGGSTPVSRLGSTSEEPPASVSAFRIPKSSSGWSSVDGRSVVDIGRPTEVPVVSALPETVPDAGASTTLHPPNDGSFLDRSARETAPSPELPSSTLPMPSPSASPAPEQGARKQALEDEPSLLADVLLAADTAGHLPGPDTPPAAAAPEEQPLRLPEAVIAETLLAPSSTPPPATGDSDESMREKITAAVEAMVDVDRRAGLRRSLGVSTSFEAQSRLDKLPTSFAPELNTAAKDWGVPRADPSTLPLNFY